jgi:ankyrin repeat protein
VAGQVARRARLERRRDGTSTLHELAVDGDVARLRLYRGDMDARDAAGHTALMAAVRARNVAGVTWLVENCSYVHLGAANRADCRKTALMYACEPCEPCESHGGGGDDDDDIAAAKVVAVLLAAQVDAQLLNRQSARGDTALHLACRSGYQHVVERMFQYASRGLEVGIRNVDGHTAADVARAPALRAYVSTSWPHCPMSALL